MCNRIRKDENVFFTTVQKNKKLRNKAGEFGTL